MKPIIGVATYVGLYRLYVELLNNHGLKTGFKAKGSWNKSIKFPFWDNWSYTHLIWGAFAHLLKINTATIFGLSFVNEFIYEPYRCNQFSSGNKSINYAQYCDPLGHKVADIIYTMIGYGLISYLREPLSSKNTD